MRSCIVILYIIATKTEYRNELNAAPDMIIHLSSIKPNKKNALRRSKSTIHIICIKNTSHC